MSAEPSFILSEQQTALLQTLSSQLDSSSLLWTSGYLAGLAVAKAGSPIIAASANHASVSAPILSVVYGSQTGNAKRLAERFASEAQAHGLQVNLLDAAEYPLKKIKDERYLLVVISTQGDGEVPDSARDLIDFIHSKRAPKLDAVNFAVLALGDSSYPLFCNIGKALDARLAELGAKRIKDCGICDLDIETIADPWWEETFTSLKQRFAEVSQVANQPSATVTPLHPLKTTAFNRDKPFKATVLQNQRITSDCTDKNIFHIELDLTDSGLHYQPGDSLGVWPKNNASLIDAILQLLNLDGEQSISFNKETHSLQEWLRHKREITNLSRAFLVELDKRATHKAIQTALSDDGREYLVELLNNYQLIDVLKQYPAQWTGDALVAALRPLTPRLYSIASSQKVVEDEVHLTVAKVDYHAHGEQHFGAASCYLESAEEDSEVLVYIEENKRFRLPKDASKDIIMVGPGTGIAPFRGFIQERAETEATGRNWLFFGAQHFYSQFLYQVEWQQAIKNKHLDRISLAFSRDQAEKIYVQHKLLEEGAAVWQWLDSGAYFYVCGSIEMEKDVIAALQQILIQHAGKTEEQASDYLASLQKDGRFSRDVY